MSEYIGTIAGIGEKHIEGAGFVPEQSTNVIYPEFDAKIRKFILGADAIIEGLELTGAGEGEYTLLSGLCAHQGFVGTLPNNALFNKNTIYAIFSVNHSKNGTVLDNVKFTDDETFFGEIKIYSGEGRLGYDVPSGGLASIILVEQSIPEGIEILSKIISIDGSTNKNNDIILTATRFDEHNVSVSYKYVSEPYLGEPLDGKKNKV